MDYNRRGQNEFFTLHHFLGGVVGKLENEYKRQLKKRIEDRFPDCLVLKNDEQMLQGVPDMTVLWGPYYAVLEVKRSANAPFRPNQEHYLQFVQDMGGIAFCIHPENEEEVLNALEQSFQACG
jgi:hypothetical protein